MLDIFHRRYACKKYNQNRKISESDLTKIIEAGRLAPSSMGLEPWHFLHLKNQEILQDLAPHMWGAMGKLGPGTELVALLGRTAQDMRPDGEYPVMIARDIQGQDETAVASRIKRMRDFLTKDLQLDTDAQIAEWVNRQVYLALANMMFGAALLDLDSTPIEGFNVAECSRILEAANAYDPQHFRLVVMVLFGYSAGEFRPKLRQDFSEIFSVIA